MPKNKFDRNRLQFKRLAERKDRIFIEKDQVPVTSRPANLSKAGKDIARRTADRILRALQQKRSVILAFGAHTIKNGMAPLLIGLLREGWVTHLATNGAGIIHDWEFSFRGSSGEDVRENVKNGQFGIWYETGFYINLAIITGAYEGLGYGESVGKMIFQEGINIPEVAVLLTEAKEKMESDPEKAAAAIDLAGAIQTNRLEPGFFSIPHPFKRFSVQSASYEYKIPFTGHPMFGHDIIYSHPLNNGAAVGRTALTDFLYFADSVSNLENGVYISVGSAVMSPMIFEKSLAMAQNLEIQKQRHIDNHYMIIVDLADSSWDWVKDGEPPADHPAYYLRYCKTFSRMGGEMHYLSADNRDFLLELYHNLHKEV